LPARLGLLLRPRGGRAGVSDHAAGGRPAADGRMAREPRRMSGQTGAAHRHLTRGELARKVVHIGVGLGALLVPWLTRWQGVGICIVAFLMNWLVLPGLTNHLLEREDDRRRGYADVILEYPLAVGALFLLFGSRLPVVGAAWAILAFGDGFATIVG